MNNLLKSSLYGVAGGAVSFTVMTIKGVGWHCRTAVFIEWLIISYLIFHLKLGIKGWLKGVVVAEVCVLPLTILVPFFDRNASVIAAILIFGLVGGFIGAFSEEQPERV